MTADLAMLPAWQLVKLYKSRKASPVEATKAALAMWSRALRLQAADDGVRVVQVVLPLVDTAMTAGRGANKIDAMTAARAVARGLERDRDDIFVGKARLLPFMNRLAPGVLAHALRET